MPIGHLQFRKGLQSVLAGATVYSGEPIWITDNLRLYVGDGTNKHLIQGASSVLSTGQVPYSDVNGKITGSSGLVWTAGSSLLTISGNLVLNPASGGYGLQLANVTSSSVTSPANGTLIYDSGFIKYYSGSWNTLLTSGGSATITVNGNSGINNLTFQNGISTSVSAPNATLSLDVSYAPIWTSQHIHSPILATGASTNFAIRVSSAPYIEASGAVVEIGNGGFGGGVGNFSGNSTATTGGTQLGINAASGFTGSLIDAQVNGVSKFSISGTGALSIAGALTLGSALTVANGGTGATTLTASGLLLGGGSGAITALSPSGSAKQILVQVTASGAPSWLGTLTVDYGGLGISSVGSGSILYGNSSTALTTLAIGGSGTLLVSSGSAPTWSNTVTAGTTFQAPSSSSIIALTVKGNSTANAKVFSLYDSTATTPVERAYFDVNGNLHVGTGTNTANVWGFSLGNINTTTTGASTAGAGALIYEGGALKYSDGSAWQTLGTAGSGISSLTASNGIAASPSNPITSSGTVSLDLSYSPTWTGKHIHNPATNTGTANNFAIRIISSPITETSGAVVEIGDGGFTSGGGGFTGNNTSVTGGTYLGFNAAAGFTGNLIDAQVNGTSKFSISGAGNLIISGALTLGSPLTVGNGGTGISSVGAGTLLYGSASTTLSTLAIGSSGTLLVSNGSAPTWSNSVTGGTTFLAPAVASTIALTVKGNNTASAKVFSLYDSAGTPAERAYFDANGNLFLGTGTNTANLWGLTLGSINTTTTTASTAGVGALIYEGGSLKYSNGSAWQTLGTAGSGITSLTISTGLSVSPSSPITSSGTISLDLTYSPTWTGRHIHSPTLTTGATTNFATRFSSSPVAENSSAVVQVGNGIWDGSTTGKFTGSANGTLLAINAVSGYAGNLIDFQTAGASRLSIAANGMVSLAYNGASVSTTNAALKIGATGINPLIVRTGSARSGGVYLCSFNTQEAGNETNAISLFTGASYMYLQSQVGWGIFTNGAVSGTPAVSIDTNNLVMLNTTTPLARLTIAGNTLNTDATGTTAIAVLNHSLTKNDANTRAFNSVLIQTTLATGISNTNTTINVLAIDTTNTSTTGLTTNLIKASYGGSAQFTVDSGGAVTATSFTGSGTGLTNVVKSVGLTVPTQFSVTGSPVTGTGTLAISWQSQAINTVLAGPSSGSSAVPTFRALVANDIPSSLNAGTTFAAPTTSLPNITLTTSSGVDVSSPTSGMLWWNGTNLYFRKSSSTVDLLAGGASLSVSDTVAGFVSAVTTIAMGAAFTVTGSTGTATVNLNTVTVPRGGTGLTTITSNGVLYGAGTSNVNVTTASGAAGAILQTSSSGSAPTFATTLNGVYTWGSQNNHTVTLSSGTPGTSDYAVRITSQPISASSSGVLQLGAATAFGSSGSGRFVGSGGGTLIAANITSAFAGNFIDFGSNDTTTFTSYFRVNSTGGVTAGSISSNTINVTPNGTTPQALRLLSSNGSNYLGLKAPVSMFSDFTFTLPASDGGTNGAVLQTNGSGTLSFAAPSRLLVVPLVIRYTPTATGPDIYEFVMPYATDGTTSVTWTFKRVNFRLNTPSSSGSVSININMSNDSSQFVSTTGVLTSDLSISASSYEASSTTFSTTTVTSGDKIRVNYTAIGTGASGFAVEVQLQGSCF